MIKLIGNENAKVYRRLRTWIMLGIILLAIVLVAVVLHSHQHPTPNWQQALTAKDASMQQQIAKAGKHTPGAFAAQMNQQIQQIQVNKYYIAHNIDPNLTTGWGFALMAQNLSTLLIAFIAVVAGDIVATEFSTGTIKMLLTQTSTRTKVLASKYVTALLYGLFMTVAMFILSLVVGWIFFGTAGAGTPQVYMDAHNHIQQMSEAGYLFMQYGFLLIQMVIIVTIAFMISTIFRSSALAITISLLAFLVGSTLVHALSSYAWVKYVLFANTDLSQFVIGGPSIHGLTLSFSIVMLAIYFVVMNVLSWIFFVKRDVAYT